jgi:hypothetical protein
MMRFLLAGVIAALFALPAISTLAEEAPLFAAEDPVEMVITLPLQAIYREAGEEEREQMEGQLSYRDATGESVQLSLKVRTRGVFRRENCSRPPLRLNFKKSEVMDSAVRRAGQAEAGQSLRPERAVRAGARA